MKRIFKGLLSLIKWSIFAVIMVEVISFLVISLSNYWIYGQLRDGERGNYDRYALFLEGVDDKGLTRLDRRYLKTIIDYYHGGPVGIEAIAATLQEESDTLVDVVEPYLLKIGLVTRTSSGRKVPEQAYRHLGLSIQGKMF